MRKHTFKPFPTWWAGLCSDSYTFTFCLSNLLQQPLKSTHSCVQYVYNRGILLCDSGPWTLTLLHLNGLHLKVFAPSALFVFAWHVLTYAMHLPLCRGLLVRKAREARWPPIQENATGCIRRSWCFWHTTFHILHIGTCYICFWHSKYIGFMGAGAQGWWFFFLYLCSRWCCGANPLHQEFDQHFRTIETGNFNECR